MIESLKDRIWLYLSPAVSTEDMVLEASALLQLPAVDLTTLAQLHFLLSDETRLFLADVPALMRRLPTTTAHEEEASAERIRGSIHWPLTISERMASGLPHLYVTTPAFRAYQTPEVELLVHMLEAVAHAARELAWTGTSELTLSINERRNEAERWLQHRSLQGIVRRRPTPRSLLRIRTSRHGRRFESALAAHAIHQHLVARLDHESLRHVVESRALVASDDATLFELAVTFDILDSLRAMGWNVGRMRLFSGRLRLTARLGSRKLELSYQHLPAELGAISRDRALQLAHGINVGVLRPDLVLRLFDGEVRQRTLLVEVKQGTRRDVPAYARAALRDLLAYRRAFEEELRFQRSPYGLGVAWGAGLEPAVTEEVMLATPDHLSSALAAFVSAT